MHYHWCNSFQEESFSVMNARCYEAFLTNKFPGQTYVVTTRSVCGLSVLANMTDERPRCAILCPAI